MQGRNTWKSGVGEWIGQYLSLVPASAYITVLKGNFPRCICVAVQLTAVHCDIIEEEGDFHFMTAFEMYSYFMTAILKEIKAWLYLQWKMSCFCRILTKYVK